MTIAPVAASSGQSSSGGPQTIPGSSYSSLHAWAELSYRLGRGMPRDLAYAGAFRQAALRRLATQSRR